MRDKPTDIMEQTRVRTGTFASTPEMGCTGAFLPTCPITHAVLTVFASKDPGFIGWGWEHVSVSLKKRTPTWEEMCWVKDQFWKEDEDVVQFHPAKNKNINCHPFCLHMWRNQFKPPVLPPDILIGPKTR